MIHLVQDSFSRYVLRRCCSWSFSATDVATQLFANVYLALELNLRSQIYPIRFHARKMHFAPRPCQLTQRSIVGARRLHRRTQCGAIAARAPGAQQVATACIQVETYEHFEVLTLAGCQVVKLGSDLPSYFTILRSRRRMRNPSCASFLSSYHLCQVLVRLSIMSRYRVSGRPSYSCGMMTTKSTLRCEFHRHHKMVGRTESDDYDATRSQRRVSKAGFHVNPAL